MKTQKKLLTFLLCMLLFLSVFLPAAEKKNRSSSDLVPEDYRAFYNDAQYKVHIYFKSDDCMSCLFILGKISDHFDFAQKNYAPLGILHPTDNYPVEKYNNEANLSFPIIQNSSKEEIASGFWDTISTPCIYITDKTGRVHAVKYIKSNIDEDTVELIAENVFNGKLIESWKKSSAETFKKP